MIMELLAKNQDSQLQSCLGFTMNQITSSHLKAIGAVYTVRFTRTVLGTVLE